MSKRKPIKIIKVVLSENGKTLMIYAKKGSNFLYAKVDSLGNITEIGKTIDNGDNPSRLERRIFKRFW